MTALIRSLIAATLLLGTVACRGGDDDDDADANPNQPDGGGGGTTIYDIQEGRVQTGSIVTLEGVVVIALDKYGARQGGLYVAEPAGGAYSGVYVYNPTVPGGSIDDLAPGDLVTIEGAEVVEFALAEDTSGRKLTELSPPQGGSINVIKTGTGSVPAPVVVDPRTIGCEETTCLDEAEKYEGVLIRFENVAVLEDLENATATDPLLMETRVTGPFIVQSSLTNMDTLARGDCLASITGIGDYFFDYKMLPREAGDIVKGGTGCEVENVAAGNCHDSEDNDGDGHADCQDFDCLADPTCTTATTVQAVQTDPSLRDSVVQLTGLVVTGFTTNKEYVFVQDPAGGENSGVLVYMDADYTTPPADLAIGKLVNVQGRVVEYYDMTEITGNSAAPVQMTVTGDGTVPAPITVTAATITNAATAEPYESVLIEIENVKVATEVGADTHGQWTVTGGVIIDDMMYAADPTLGDCFASIVGPLNYSFSEWKIEPRSASDLTSGSSCP